VCACVRGCVCALYRTPVLSRAFHVKCSWRHNCPNNKQSLFRYITYNSTYTHIHAHVLYAHSGKVAANFLLGG